ncbi:LacI family DNA-binding transcriptional regulator [Fulvivirgaceae bacterium BMA12]|uniref:LacI family DNA-binding transcriptional regulator n=1 Tax=Agaribacillus aureus TaxID=3051825 RepID=A0ABT8LC04_9BACT|nr:LacI family DNA-binding transcriptional regulator [Fulvivirgaceae bacterium BMA12]
MEKKNYTIKEIAKLAKVSRGTVDRILHQRGNVSDKARQKVEDILKRIDYSPNIIARSLKANKKNRVVVLLPSNEKDSYWDQSVNGILEATKKANQFNVSIDIKKFDVDHPDSFNKLVNEIFIDPPEGILLAPLFYDQSLDFLVKCISANIPYILFNTHIEDSQSLCFIGQDLFASGRVSADLLNLIKIPNKRILIIHFDEDPDTSNHLKEKEIGFRRYFEEKRISVVIESMRLSSHLADHAEEQLQEIFGHDDIGGIYVSTSKAHIIADFLQKKSLQKIPLVGYDLIAENINYLKSGEINFLINQNPKLQAYLGTSYLSDFLVFGKKIERTKLLPLDIITVENLDFYL